MHANTICCCECWTRSAHGNRECIVRCCSMCMHANGICFSECWTRSVHGNRERILQNQFEMRKSTQWSATYMHHHLHSVKHADKFMPHDMG